MSLNTSTEALQAQFQKFCRWHRQEDSAGGATTFLPGERGVGPKARGQSRQIQSKVLQEPKAEATVLLLCRNLSLISR